MKQRVEIRKNEWDNWCGYVNGRKVIDFSTTVLAKADDVANMWMSEMDRIEVYVNRVTQTGQPGNYAYSVDGNFQDTFLSKKELIKYVTKLCEQKVLADIKNLK
jgi:hypothetical protein